LVLFAAVFPDWSDVGGGLLILAAFFGAFLPKELGLENQILVLIPNLFYPFIPCIVHTNVNN
jgi:hypothetical protein